MGWICVISAMPFGVGRVDDIARVDLAQADAARHRRHHLGVAELQPRIVDIALVGLDHAFILAH